MSAHVEPGPIPESWWVRQGVGPRVAVIAAIHGDEPAGLSALEAARAGEFPAAGEFLLIHGNPAATALGMRHTPSGVDLNRICDLEFVGRLSVSDYSPEHHRALELTSALKEVDAAIDLHMTSGPTVPFALAIGPHSLPASVALGLPEVTYGWEETTDISAGIALSCVSARGPAVAVECGQQGDANATQIAIDAVRRFVASLEGSASASASRAPLRVVGQSPVLGPGFAFSRPLGSFDALRGGEVFARDQERDYVAPQDCRALLPNPNVALGKPALYFAVPTPL